MDVRFIQNENLSVANGDGNEITYYKRKNKAVKNMIEKVLEELNSPDELTEDKKKQLKQTLTTAHEYLKVSWYSSADYRWLNYSRWVRF